MSFRLSSLAFILSALSAPMMLTLQAAGAVSGTPAFDSIRRAQEPRPESLAGHGVDLATGMQNLERILLPFDAGQPFNLALRYNSLFAGVDGMLGRGWRHDYDATIADRMTITWGGHYQNTYRFIGLVDGQRRYRSDEIAARRDSLVLDSNNLFTLTRGDGTQYVFGRTSGVLFEVRNKVGQSHDLNPDPNGANRPRTVRAVLTGAEIRFVYNREGQIDFIHDGLPSGGTPRYVDFTYDAQRRLTRITQPVQFTSDEYPWSPTQIIAPAGSAAGTIVNRNIPRTAPIGLVRITSGTISTGRSEDLVLRLISPRGTEATIYDQVPDPTVSRSLAGLSTLTSAFDGENPNGTWRLVVISRSATSEARITSFGIRFSDPSNPTNYAYDSAHRLASVRDPVGQIIANTYDSAGRVVTQDDGRSDNQLLRFHYEERPDDTLLTTVTDREGRTSSVLHDARHRLLRWTDALVQSVNFGYDSSGNRTMRTSALGHVTRFAYDPQHNLTSVTDPAGKVTLFEYDARRNLQMVHDPRGTETRFGYDVRNNLTSVTDFLGRTTTWVFSNNSQLRSVTLPDGAKIDLGYASDNTINFVAHPTNSSRGTSVNYDGQGRVTRRTDSAGNATTFTYSPTGKVLSERAADGRTKTFTYDARDRLLTETDLLGQSTRYEYDGNDNVVLVTNALGQQTRHVYDGEDRLVGIVDPLNQTRSSTYDAAGQTLTETDGLGRTTRYQYDADGNLLSVEDPAGITTQRYRYTARAELEGEVGAYNHPIVSTYDDMGNLASVTDPAGRRINYTYDPLNRHVTLTDAANRISRQSFDSDGQIEAIIDPGGRRTGFAYDRANRLTEIIFGPRIISYTYNERDLVTEIHDGTRRYQYDYDSLGRRIRMRVFPNNVTTAERTLTYTYDAKGNLLGTADSGDGRSVSRQLDALERVTSYTDASGRQINYGYDAAGRLNRLTYPGGREVRYSYDAADQLIEVTDWANRRTRFSYDLSGRIKRVDFPNGTYRVIAYDRAGRPTTRSDHEPGGAVVCGYRYEYAIDGRLDTVTRTDTLLRFAPVPATMTFDDANRVTSYNGSPLTSELGGGLTRVPLTNGFASVTYDTRHRVSTLGATTFNYDPEDRLTGWRDNTGTTTLLVDPHAGLSRVLERTSPDGSTTRYVHGMGLLYEETGTTIRVYHYDDRGSTVALSDDAGRVTQRFAYGPYGEEIGPNASGSVTPFRFLGLFGVLTEPNGNLSMRTRFYSPVLRRFISEDFYPGELATPNSLNRYAYANGDPISFEDPDGEFVNVLIGAVAGAIGGVAVQAVSDLIRGKKPNWRDYVSAAAGGAVTGALIGSGFGAVAAGAAGGLTQNFLDQSLNGALTGERDFDFVALGVATGLGAAGGKLGKFAPGINGAAGSAFRKQVVYNGILFSTKRAALRAPVMDLVKRSAVAAISQAASGAGLGAAKGTYLRLTAGNGDGPGTSAPGIPPTIRSRGRYDQIHSFVGQGQRSRQGRFLHFSLYETWLRAALVPLPNSPNAQPTSF